VAFCNNNAGCGHSCGRQDNHGGECDCYEGACKHSSRYKVPVEPPKPAKPLATLYAIRCVGRFYHTYSRAGGKSWVDKLEDAKVWTRRGPAQGMITKLSTKVFHKGPGPAPALELVELIVTDVRVIDQAARLAEVQAKKERDEAYQRAERSQQELAEAQRNFDRATARLREAEGNLKT
jgi:hypothetical protein